MSDISAWASLSAPPHTPYTRNTHIYREPATPLQSAAEVDRLELHVERLNLQLQQSCHELQAMRVERDQLAQQVLGSLPYGGDRKGGVEAGCPFHSAMQQTQLQNN